MKRCSRSTWLAFVSCVPVLAGACGPKYEAPPPEVPAAAAASSGKARARAGNCGGMRALPAAGLSDDQITAAVVLELIQDPSIDAAHIRLETHDGIVELEGSTTNVLGKQRAAAHAELIKGVRAVIDRVKVEPPEVSDEELLESVHHALVLDPAANSYQIQIGAHRGIVTLQGAVDSFAQRQLADVVASGVRGVREVENRITIRPSPSRPDSEIEADVSDRLRWDVLIDATKLSVESEDGMLSLDGRVGTPAERSRAYANAWVRGVRSVDVSELYVSPELTDHELRRASAHPPDTEVANAVGEALSYDPRVQRGDVRIRVANGVVALEGQVDNLKAKRAAEEDARETVGVVRIDDRIAVRTAEQIQDREIAQRVGLMLALNPRTSGYPIAVEARDGLVVLRGAVSSYFEKAQAEDLAAGVLGVHDVENDLSVHAQILPYTRDPYLYPYELYGPERAGAATPTRSDAEVAQAIERKLLWSPFVDASHIGACVNDGKAVLTGFADSAREYETAARLALDSGAVVVSNQLVLR